MPRNIGTVDRVIRIVIAAVLAVLIFTGQVSTTAAIILGVVAVILLLTSIVAFCPIYFPFKLSTAKKKA